MGQIEKLIALERAEVGTKAADNKVCKYTKDYGLSYGVDWCVIFQWDMFRLAGLSLLFYDGGKTASCGQFYNWAKSKGLVVNEPMPGDIVIFSFTQPHDHMGLCVAASSGKITTIDGNTSNNASQSQGGMVLERTRTRNNIFAIIRPQYKAETYTYYVVQKGDNLTKIAKKYGYASYKELLPMNPEITNPNIIRVGQKIRVK